MGPNHGLTLDAPTQLLRKRGVGAAGKREGGLVAVGCVVRHGPPRDSGPAHHERVGRGWEALVRVGCQGWLGCAFGVGCYWVPAGDAGMAEEEEDGRVTDAAPTKDRTGVQRAD